MKNLNNKLAIDGGVPVIVNDSNYKHAAWPPNSDKTELEALSKQRNLDIGIKGRAGPIAEFEDMFVTKIMNNSVKYAVTYNSGTSGLFAAFIALGITEGDEVIGPVLTYHAALSPLHMIKARVVLADVDIQTKCILPEEIEKRITSKTKAIVVVHQWGHPADMNKIMRIAKKHSLKVIEDCSHAHGSKYQDKFVGSIGDVAVFSLQTNKAIFAGEGGILVTNDQNIHDRAVLVGHYRDRSKDEIKNPLYQQYWVTGFGMKLRMSPFNAIVAQFSLKNFSEMIKNRHKCLEYLTDKISEDICYIEAPRIKNNVFMGAWYGYKPLYKKEKLKNVSREKFVEIAKAEGMQISAPSGGVLSEQILYSSKNTELFPEFDRFQNDIKNTPNAEYLEEVSLSFPVFSNWKEDKKIIDQYIEILKKIEENVISSISVNFG